MFGIFSAAVVTRPQRGRLLAKKRAKIKSDNKMASSRFATLNNEEISKLMPQKCGKNTKKVGEGLPINF